MKKIFYILILFVFLSTSGCAWFKKNDVDAAPRAERPTLLKREAIQIAKDFAEKEGLSEEFRLRSPSKVQRYLTIGQDPHWVWQIYFPHESQKMVKFYNKSPLLIQINAISGEVENWGRR